MDMEKDDKQINWVISKICHLMVKTKIIRENHIFLNFSLINNWIDALLSECTDARTIAYTTKVTTSDWYFNWDEVIWMSTRDTDDILTVSYILCF